MVPSRVLAHHVLVNQIVFVAPGRSGDFAPPPRLCAPMTLGRRGVVMPIYCRDLTAIPQHSQHIQYAHIFCCGR
eukprot:scaffold96137_cov35-Tisochrysis_lutea.AAC.2